METPVQEREPPVDYRLSLLHGRVQWKDSEGPYGVGNCKMTGLTELPSTASLALQKPQSSMT